MKDFNIVNKLLIFFTSYIIYEFVVFQIFSYIGFFPSGNDIDGSVLIALAAVSHPIAANTILGLLVKKNLAWPIWCFFRETHQSTQRYHVCVNFF